MDWLKGFLRALGIMLFVSSILAGFIGYKTGRKPVNNNMLEILIPDEYCIYVKRTSETKFIFSELLDSDCWKIKNFILIHVTKILNVGKYEFEEPKPGLEYYYSSRISFFLNWYSGISFLISVWIYNLQKKIKINE